MSQASRSSFTVATFALAVAASLSATQALAATYQIIANFTGFQDADGDTPSSDLVADSAGRLYGTTMFGGKFAGGAVYRLTKNGNTWSKETLFSFPAGSGPSGGVLIGPSGELYGTTTTSSSGNGTVWRLDLAGSTWTLTTLHVFNPTGGLDGFHPSAGVVFGKDGLLYGTTTGSPPQDSSVNSTSVQFGTVYSVSPLGDATEYSVLHIFGGTNDGQFPKLGRLLVNKAGVLTGTTELGGKFSDGTLFRLKPPSNNKKPWTETILHDFGAPNSFDAIAPFQNPVEGEGGVLFGCTGGGDHGLGAIYAVTPPETAGAAWGERVLYNFGDRADDASVAPACELTENSHGVLFGSATDGGFVNKGAFFKLVPPAAGQTLWSEAVVHSFDRNPADGAQPLYGPLRIGAAYYGTTNSGGSGGRGVAYQIVP